MGLDISACKRAEEALRAADERFRQTATSANVGLWDWDLRLDRVYYSSRWKDMLGLPRHEVMETLELG